MGGRDRREGDAVLPGTKFKGERTPVWAVRGSRHQAPWRNSPGGFRGVRRGGLLPFGGGAGSLEQYQRTDRNGSRRDDSSEKTTTYRGPKAIGHRSAGKSRRDPRRYAVRDSGSVLRR